LSKVYVNAHAKLKWQCKEGHIWEARPSDVKSGGWCATCNFIKLADKHRGNIQKMNNIAAKRGGKCLSKTYVDAHTKLKWQCTEGHQWEAPPGGVVRGTWCPACGAKRGWEKRRNAAQKITPSTVVAK